MIEKYKTYALEQGDLSILHKVVIESPECAPNGEKYEFFLLEILKHLGTNKEVIRCGPGLFEHMDIKYKQGKWIVTMTAIEKKE